MKKLLLGSIAFALLIASAALVSGFSSSPVGWPGKVDNETEWYIAGDTVLQGQVVSLDFSYNAYTTGTYDTAAVVVRSTDENDTWVAGLAMVDAIPGQSVKVIVRGIYSAKIDGSDSNITSLTNLAPGDFLSTADRDGFLGSIEGDSIVTVVAIGDTIATATGANRLSYTDVPRVMPVARLLEAVAATDTGALTTYDVYIDVRSRP